MTGSSSRVRAVASASLFLAAALLSRPATAQSAPIPNPGQPAARSYAVPPGALIAPGNSPPLMFLYTGNVVGYVDPCG